MRELDRICRALCAAEARGEAALLATVVGVDGSVYRGTGARMVVAENGETTGAVSGGCLEADIIARAPNLYDSITPELIQYDTRSTDDPLLGLGLGCQGVIDILLEPLRSDSLRQAIELYSRLLARGEDCTLVTLVRGGTPDLPVGSRAVLGDAGALEEGDPRVLERAGDVARELIRPALPLVICGGGTDAIPLAQLAKSMGWHVTVVDHRALFVTRERFSGADALVCVNASDAATVLGSRVQLDGRTMAVSMAHSATYDRAYLHALLDAGAAYIGVLGPLRRTRELLGDRTGAAGEIPPNVHAPIGLDIGAETPDEIALAIVAEIAAVSAGRSGGMLRNRTGPIHNRHMSS